VLYLKIFLLRLLFGSLIDRST